MKTLYIRIVITFILIAMVSCILALILSNVYYSTRISGDNERKIITIGKEIRALFEQTPNQDIDEYLTHISNMGFQIYAVNDQMKERFYGSPFRHKEFDPEQIRRVLAGETYDGVKEERHVLKIFGYFENSISNSIGLPVKVHGQTYALFIRPNLEQQIGEVRLIMAQLLGFTFLFSILLIVLLTQYIVRPVKKLTEATDKIVGGDYNIEMEVSRRDEIGDLARHFTQMALSLKQLDTMRQEFVANVSHEIQSPLTSIQGFAQAVLEGDGSPEEEERYLRIIVEESGRLSSLSKQLLTLASLDTESYTMKPTAFRLDEQIRQMLIVTEWQWTEKGLFIEPELPEVVLNGDPQLLYQVWMNLLTNSIKFCRPGDTIRVEIVDEQQGIVVKISDTGIGIPESELPHIFERFYKADKARNRTMKGSGLGLAIASKIVALHHGHMEVQSQLGSGTTFSIRLPHL